MNAKGLPLDLIVGQNPAAEARNRKVLGRAIHPQALARVHDFWPDAYITVRHTYERLPDDREPQRMDSTPTLTRQITTVTIRPRKGDALYISGTAECHPHDQWVRRDGVRLAFNRALERLRKSERQRNWENAQRLNAGQPARTA